MSTDDDQPVTPHVWVLPADRARSGMRPAPRFALCRRRVCRGLGFPAVVVWDGTACRGTGRSQSARASVLASTCSPVSRTGGMTR